MIEMRVSLDTTGVTRMTRTLWRDQLPFATSVALNDMAKQSQAVQHAHMLRAFTTRRPAFVGKAVKIKPFATKRRLQVTLLIEPPGGVKRADVLSKFEDGGTKTAQGRIAIPVDARRGAAGVVSAAQRPKAFGFTLQGRGQKASVFRGDDRTFMIRPNNGKGGGIFQRLGGRTLEGPQGRDAAGRYTVGTKRKRNGRVRMLYSFARTAKIDDRLHFEDNVVRTVRGAWPTTFGRAFEQATRTASRPTREWGQF